MLKKGRDSCKEDLGRAGQDPKGQVGGAGLSSEHRRLPRSCCRS